MIEFINCIRRGRLRWLGHVERCSNDSVVKKYRDIVVKGQQRKGRSRKTWYQVMDSDLRFLKIDRDLAQNRTKWKIFQTLNANFSFRGICAPS